MQIIILDDNNSLKMTDLISNILIEYFQITDLSIVQVKSTFALATHIYDENKGDVDLIFAKVNGENDDSIRVVRDIQGYFPHIQAIFYSDNNECIESMFQAVPTFFLKIPIDQRVLRNSLQRVINNFRENQNQTIQIRSKGQLHRIKFNSIKYIESLGRKLEIYTNEGLYEINMTMPDILDKLPSQFLLTHRSFIVNTDKVIRYGENQLEISTHERIPLSKSQKKCVMDALSGKSIIG